MGAVRGGRLPRARYTGSTFWICEECFRRLDEQTGIYEPVALLPLELLTQKKEHCYSSRGVTSVLPRRAECHRTFLDAERYIWVGLGLFCFVFAFFHSSVGVINAWVSTRRAWHLDAASRSASRRLAAGVSGLLYYFHIYFLRSPVFPLRLDLIVCIMFI